MHKECGHYGQPVAGICKLCSRHYCRDCGSPQVVTVRKTVWFERYGMPPEAHPYDDKEMWPLCHVCAAKMPPIWVEPAPLPPVTIETTVSNKTNPIDWGKVTRLLDTFAYGPSASTSHAPWPPYGKSPVTKLVEEEQAKQAKPSKPKKTPQSALEADVEQFLRECDDD